MIKKKNETGRSMVEMLGVLAIIGVLSIGGIAGYTMSMRRHRANQVADLINKYAAIVYSSCQKAISDGTIKRIHDCYHQHIPSFKDSDLGTSAEIDTLSLSSMGQSSTTHVDHVILTAYFNDEQVCKVVKSMVNHEKNPGCTGASSHSYYPLTVRIFQY